MGLAAFANKAWRRLRVIYLRRRFGSFGRASYVEAPIDLLTNPANIKIGRGVYVRHHARLECHRPSATGRPGRLEIGDGTHIEGYCSLGAASSVIVGRDVLIGSNVAIRDHDHGFEDTRRHRLKQDLKVDPVEIEDYVWLGQNCVVLKGVRIGAGAVVGANAVVTHSVPSGAIVAGVPADIIGWCKSDENSNGADSGTRGSAPLRDEGNLASGARDDSRKGAGQDLEIQP